MFHLQILPHDFDYLGALQDRQRVEHGSCHLATSMTLCPYRRPQERAHASLEEHLATSFTEAEDLTLTTGDIGTARAPFMSTSVAVRRNIPDAGGFDFGQSHRKGRSPRRIASTAGLERAATSAAELREDRREIEAAQGKPLPHTIIERAPFLLPQRGAKPTPVESVEGVRRPGLSYRSGRGVKFPCTPGTLRTERCSHA
jgi:hypothetical protein